MSRVPAHVACVMDGNGRWAQRRGLARTEGHAAGEEALFDAVEGALELGLKWLTVYAFSTENWSRPIDEVRFLMNFNEVILTRHRDDLNGKGVRILFSGRRDWRVPKRLLRHIEESESLTARNRRMTLNFAFNYGGRAEIVDAVRRLVADGVVRHTLHLPPWSWRPVTILHELAHVAAQPILWARPHGPQFVRLWVDAVAAIAGAESARRLRGALGAEGIGWSTRTRVAADRERGLVELGHLLRPGAPDGNFA